MYRERAHPAAVVACTWTQSARRPDRQLVVPDGCVDVVLDAAGVTVAGPDTTAWWAPLGAAERVVGLRLRPGGAPGVLGLPAHALRDQRTPWNELPALRPARSRRAVPAAELGTAELMDRVHAAADPEGELARLVLGDCGGAPPPWVGRLCPPGPPWPRTAAVAAALGLGERALHRRCLEHFGYGPKTLQRIVRFQRALRAARAGRDFAELAYALGYADQAHLAHDVRALAGVPLGQLVLG